MAVGLVLALGLPMLRLDLLLGLDRRIGALLAFEAIWWGLAVLVLAWVVLVEKRPLASIGFVRLRWNSLGWAFAAAATLLAGAAAGYAWILPALGFEANMEAIASISALPLWLQFALFLRAGLVEELIYRGYAIERIEALSGSRLLAAFVPALLFVAMHFAYWGAGHLIVVAFATLILTLLYLWRRDLPCCMIAHLLADSLFFALVATTA